MFRVIRCLCYKGETLAQSINGPMKESTGPEFDLRCKAERWKNRLEKQEEQRIKDERSCGIWNGNEFIFWIDDLNKNDK